MKSCQTRDAGGVAGLVEFVGLVDAWSPDAEHVDARLDRKRHCASERRRIVLQSHRIDLRPDGAAAENGWPLTQAESFTVGAAVDLDRPEADARRRSISTPSRRDEIVEVRDAHVCGPSGARPAIRNSPQIPYPTRARARPSRFAAGIHRRRMRRAVERSRASTPSSPSSRVATTHSSNREPSRTRRRATAPQAARAARSPA